MKLRFCAIIASTMLAGCVLTDENNQTGGDFISAHGGAVQPSNAKTLAVPVDSVEVIPLDGLPAMHGTEDVVLGSLGQDSIRLIQAFDLFDTTLRPVAWRQRDSLPRIRMISSDSIPALSVRARFYLLSDPDNLYGLLAGLEPSAMSLNTPDAEVEIKLDGPSHHAVGNTFQLTLPQDLGKQVQGLLLSATKVKKWLVVLLDTRTARSGGVDGKVNFLSGATLVGHDTSVTHDTAGVLSLGVLDGNYTWRSVGLRPKNGPVTLGLWPSGGQRLRVHLDSAQLRQEMWSKFGITNPDVVGGYDNTFNILQARISAKFSSVTSDDTVPHSVRISSTVINRPYGQVSVASLSGSGSITLLLPDTIRRICGLTVNPQLNFTKKPSGYLMEVMVENVAQNLPTRLSLSLGRTDIKVAKPFIAEGDPVEFLLETLVRVQVAAQNNQVSVTYQTIEQAPTSNSQYGADGTIRTSSQLQRRSGAFTISQEIRNPLTQLMNRPREVDLDVSTYATGNSNRIFAVPSDPSKIFDSVKVVVRPLLGRNN